MWVYGIVLPPVEEEADSGDLDALIDSAEPIEIASAMSHPPAPGAPTGTRNGPGTLRPPAIITEFMSQGSLKGALSRKLEILQPPLMRLMVALDAAKVFLMLTAHSCSPPTPVASFPPDPTLYPSV